MDPAWPAMPNITRPAPCLEAGPKMRGNYILLKGEKFSEVVGYRGCYYYYYYYYSYSHLSALFGRVAAGPEGRPGKPP